MLTINVHLFIAQFGSHESAIEFCERDWGDAPDDDDSQEIWDSWEAEFPKWPLKDELGLIYLDEDFVELHFGPEVEARLEDFVKIKSQTAQRVNTECDTLIVIGHEALGGFEVELKSTPRFQYLGVFEQN